MSATASQSNSVKLNLPGHYTVPPGPWNPDTAQAGFLKAPSTRAISRVLNFATRPASSGGTTEKTRRCLGG